MKDNHKRKGRWVFVEMEGKRREGKGRGVLSEIEMNLYGGRQKQIKKVEKTVSEGKEYVLPYVEGEGATCG